MIAREEAKAAPRWFDDFTDGGTVSVSEFVTRFRWTCPDRAHLAALCARMLDIADADRLRERSPGAWSSVVCSLVAVYLMEIQPAFARASRIAAARGLASLRFRCVGGLGGERAPSGRGCWMSLCLSDDADEYEDVD